MDATGPCRSIQRAERGAIQAYDPVAYFTERCPVRGFPRFSADYLGSTFYFSTMSNRETFTTHPERFAPQYAEYCAFGVAKGYKAAIDLESFTIVEGKLYLNYSPSVLAGWRKDIPGYIQQADPNWSEVSHQTKIHQ
jgi:YHS domain-containing protein